jgi:hypothetical protein
MVLRAVGAEIPLSVFDRAKRILFVIVSSVENTQLLSRANGYVLPRHSEVEVWGKPTGKKTWSYPLTRRP